MRSLASSVPDFMTEVQRIVSPARAQLGPMEGRDTSDLSRRCAGLIWPRTTTEIRKILALAVRFGVPLHPVSTGRNGGYGDFFPTQADCVVMNLRLMNQILGYNSEQGWVRIEPGVSQGQLHAYLKQKRSLFCFEPTQSSPETSILGNALERGWTFFSSRESECLGASLLLTDGQHIRVGFDAEAKSPLAAGVNLQSLLFQNSLGVVVEGTFRLTKIKAEWTYALSFISFRDFASSVGRLEQDFNIKPLRWFDAHHVARSPLADQGRNLSVLISVSSKRLSPTEARAVQRAIGCETVTSLPKSHLYLSAEETSNLPLSYLPFSTRRSPRDLNHAQRTAKELAKKNNYTLSLSVSFTAHPAAAIFVMRLEPKGQAKSLNFLYLSLEKQGYRPYRTHSAQGRPTTSPWQKDLRRVFDPHSILTGWDSR